MLCVFAVCVMIFLVSFINIRLRAVHWVQLMVSGGNHLSLFYPSHLLLLLLWQDVNVSCLCSLPVVPLVLLTLKNLPCWDFRPSQTDKKRISKIIESYHLLSKTWQANCIVAMLSGFASFMKDTRIADRNQSILEDCIHFDALKCCLGSLVTAFWSKAYELAVLMWDLTSLPALEVSVSMPWCLTTKEPFSNWCLLCARGAPRTGGETDLFPKASQRLM